MVVGTTGKDRILLTCGCGRTRDVLVASVVSGRSRSCGRCSSIRVRRGDVFHGLTYDGDDGEIQPESQKKVPVRCGCGKTFETRIFTLTRGRVKTCGHCHDVTLRRGDRFGGFTYAGDGITFGPMSHRSAPFTCRCGRTSVMKVNGISRGKTDCGECKKVALTDGSRYGSMTYAGPGVLVHPWSKSDLPFRCRCGNVKAVKVALVTSGDVTTCGNCFSRVHSWFVENESALRSMRGLVRAADFPPGGPVPIGDIDGVVRPFRASCPLCQGEYGPRLSDVKRGGSLTCGCAGNKISAPNREIADFIQGLGFRVELEYEISGKSYDVCVPDAGLIVEHHGVRWHSNDRSRRNDLDKYVTATSRGFSVVSMFEDDWRDRRTVMESILRSRLGRSVPAIKLRPGSCEIRPISSREARPLYDRFHYLGHAHAMCHVGVIHGGVVIGCASFRKPSRQSSRHDFELSRMVMDSGYRVHGVWTKVVRYFIREFAPSSIVSFSDNRLFTGGVYAAIGFKADGDVKPDYYWVKGDNRYHKSGLRKPVGYAGTERDLRESEGYKKIWDLGKKRWVMECVHSA